ncbi:hypothetical protein [Mesorhizobium sp. M0244]
MTLAARYRLVDDAAIFEMNVESAGVWLPWRICSGSLPRRSSIDRAASTF